MNTEAKNPIGRAQECINCSYETEEIGTA